ncbi:hypothetical protein BRADI_2g21455v3 [Brachypodium distachyon]|uniref:Uncharacterized protein n=1 Tax=Brachypodium distachyon TaxID=15368 RepID=A0A2K2D9S5_BRADI|nr:hypothetical protein BRADI_2g21455v3 [Brachypodium distachyon]
MGGGLVLSLLSRPDNIYCEKGKTLPSFVFPTGLQGQAGGRVKVMEQSWTRSLLRRCHTKKSSSGRRRSPFFLTWLANHAMYILLFMLPFYSWKYLPIDLG